MMLVFPPVCPKLYVTVGTGPFGWVADSKEETKIRSSFREKGFLMTTAGVEPAIS